MEHASAEFLAVEHDNIVCLKHVEFAPVSGAEHSRDSYVLYTRLNICGQGRFTMVEIFNNIVLKVIAAKLTRDVGWLKVRHRSLEVMADALHRFMKDISIRVYRYAEFSGRTEPSVNDINLVLQDMNINITELEKYKHKTKTVTTIFHVSQYPVPSHDQLNLPSVETDFEDNDSAKQNSETGSMCDNIPDIPSANTHSLQQNDDFEMNSVSSKETAEVSFSVDGPEKPIEGEIREKENGKDELNEKTIITSVPKAKRRRRRKKDEPENIASCKLNTAQSTLKTDEINVFESVRKVEDRSTLAPMDITVSDELHIHLDFPKIIIKRIKAEGKMLENLCARELNGNSLSKKNNASVQRKRKMKSRDKKK